MKSRWFCWPRQFQANQLIAAASSTAERIIYLVAQSHQTRCLPVGCKHHTRIWGGRGDRPWSHCRADATIWNAWCWGRGSQRAIARRRRSSSVIYTDVLDKGNVYTALSRQNRRLLNTLAMLVRMQCGDQLQWQQCIGKCHAICDLAPWKVYVMFTAIKNMCNMDGNTTFNKVLSRISERFLGTYPQ